MGHLIYKVKHVSTKSNMTDSGENCHGFNKSQSPRCSLVRNESSSPEDQEETQIA